MTAAIEAIRCNETVLAVAGFAGTRAPGRPSSTTLVGSSLVFDRTRQALIAAEPDAISIVELGAGGQTTRLPIRDARAVAAFADQLWIATFDDPRAQVEHAGRVLATTWSPPFAARAVLEPAPGPAAAIWSSAPAVALIDDFGQLTSIELADVEITPPVTGRRFVTARGTKLTLPSGLVTTSPPNTTVLGGAVLSNGKSVTLLVADTGGRGLIAVSLGTGQITQRRATPASTVRLATRHDLAIVQLESRVLWILDLPAGRELGTLRLDHDVDDFVIDPGGHRVAVRCGNGAIELHELADLLRRPPATVRAAAHIRTACPMPEPRETTSVSPDPVTVFIAPEDLFDWSEADDEPTVEILRPGSRAEPGPAEVGPDSVEDVDADVITSALCGRGAR